MFTGIITDIGEVLEVERRGDLRARIATRHDVSGIDIGASIACDGVCLTVIALGETPRGWFDVEISAETVSRTNIGHDGWPVGRRVNLERALRVGDELGGHIVTGHVDGVGEVVSSKIAGDSREVTIRVSKDLAPFIAAKGSITVDGVSLTVNAVSDEEEGALFTLNIIPHTAQVTTLGELQSGRAVNLEIDILARYLARMEKVRSLA